MSYILDKLNNAKQQAAQNDSAGTTQSRVTSALPQDIAQHNAETAKITVPLADRWNPVYGNYSSATGLPESSDGEMTWLAELKAKTASSSAAQNKHVPSGMEYVNGRLQIKEGYEADPVTGFVLPTTEKALENIESEKYILPASLLQGADQAATGITSTLDWLFGRPLQALGWENNPISALNEKLQSEKEQNRQYFAQKMEDDTSSQALSDIGTQVVAALPDALLASLTAGGSVAAQATAKGLQAASAASKAATGNKIIDAASTAASALNGMVRNPQTWLSFSRVAGPSYDQAVYDGADNVKASAYAVINGLLNTIVEIGGGGIQELPSAVRQGGNALRQWVDTMIDEGKEEAVQGVIERLTQNVVYGKDNPIYSTTDENAVLNPVTSLKEAGMGALVGGVLGGGQIAINNALSGSNTDSDAYSEFLKTAGLDTDVQQNAAPAQPESVQTGAVQADAAVPSASALDVLLSGNVTNSVAERIVTDPQLRAEFEQRSGIKLEGSESQMRNAVRSYAEGDVGQFRPETAADDIVEADVDMPPVVPDNVQDIQQSVVDNAAPAEAAGTGVNAVGAAERGFSPAINAELTQAYEQALDRYGAMPARENLARQMDVPRSTDGETVVPRTVQSAIGSDITSAEAVGEITNLIAQHGLDRAVITDRAAQSRAQSTISEKGWDAALRDWTAEVRSGKVSKDLTTLGLELYNNAVNSGHAREAVEILTDLADSVRSGAQSTQVMHLLQKLTPQGQLYGIQRTVQNLKQELAERYKDKAPDLTLNEDLVSNFLSAETDAERASALDAIYQDVANQMPVRWIDKLNAWRYLSMLGNPRTHVRNILGNLMFAPVRATKDVVAAGLEAAFIRDPSQRTKAVNSRLLNAEDRARYAAAVADYAEVADMISSGGKFQNDYNEIRSRQRIFKNDLLEAARVKNSELLDAEDVWFSKPAYASALSQYLKAQGITAEQYLSEGFDKTAAQAYAVKEAQKAVYRDYNAFSDFVSGLGKSKYKAVRGFVEGVLPFKRTPANILARGMEYSPFGLAKGIYDAIFNVRNGKMTAAEAIDSISSGLTGTGLLALGAMLAAQGLLSGGSSGDEKQDAFDEMRGAQNYALTIGNRSYTLDWLAPEALPLFVGVEMYKAFGDDSLTFSDIWQSLNRITDPMFEMSMLSGVNDLLDSVSFVQDTNTIWPLLASAATSYLSQYIPTLFGQIERTFFEDTRQSTYTDKDAFLPTDVQYAMSQAANKLPGVEYQQVDYIDAWGRKESTGSLAERAFNNFLNPAYVSKDASTSVDDKLQAIYDATGGEYNVFPERVTMNTTVNGEKFTDPETYEQYATALGQKRLELVEDFFNSSTAEALTPQQQGAIIEKLYDYAKQVTQQELMGKKPESSVAKAEEYGDPAEYFLFNEALQTIEDTRGSNMAAFNAVMEDYENMSAQRQQALMEALGEGTRFDDVVDAYQAGIQPNQWYKAYSKWQSIGEGDGSANDKATEFANWLDSVTNYSAEQSELLQDQMIYYTMIRGNSDRYDELRDLGFTPAESIDLYEYIGEMNKLSSDTDAEGNTISGSKKAKVIDFIDTLDLTPDEKDLIFITFTNYKGLEDTPWHNR